MTPDGCQNLDFEAEILGKPVWRLDVAEQAGEAVSAAHEAGVALMHHRGPASAGPVLENHGFRKIETLVTFEGVGPDLARAVRLRDATLSDAETVGDIAAASFRFDRWHADPMIPSAAADSYKAQWARNDVTGRAETVLLAVSEAGAIEGFNALLYRPPAAVIDLIAVAPAHQGRGVGRRLMAGAFAAARRAGLKTLRVGTQAANEGSIRLYRAFGMEETGRAETWHWVP